MNSMIRFDTRSCLRMVMEPATPTLPESSPEAQESVSFRSSRSSKAETAQSRSCTPSGVISRMLLRRLNSMTFSWRSRHCRE